MAVKLNKLFLPLVIEENSYTHNTIIFKNNDFHLPVSSKLYIFDKWYIINTNERNKILTIVDQEGERLEIVLPFEAKFNTEMMTYHRTNLDHRYYYIDRKIFSLSKKLVFNGELDNFSVSPDEKYIATFHRNELAFYYLPSCEFISSYKFTYGEIYSEPNLWKDDHFYTIKFNQIWKFSIGGGRYEINSLCDREIIFFDFMERENLFIIITNQDSRTRCISFYDPSFSLISSHPISQGNAPYTRVFRHEYLLIFCLNKIVFDVYSFSTIRQELYKEVKEIEKMYLEGDFNEQKSSVIEIMINHLSLRLC